MLDMLEHEVFRDHIQYIRIDGSTSMASRQQQVQRFQQQQTCRVALLSIRAVACGITLTAAQHVIFTELCFGPEVHLQAEDRAHRLGQTQTVFVRYLVCANSMDDLLFGMIQKKYATSSLVLDGAKRYLPNKRKLVELEDVQEDESNLSGMEEQDGHVDQ
jgi:SWI/SNF-related matrix-associated actin-dependent regulator 1 of chromatin subfamily A